MPTTADADAFLSALRLSDSFLPVGSYTASYGLEQYVNEDRIADGDDLRELIAAYLRQLVGPCETVAVANAHAASAGVDREQLFAVHEQLHAVTMPAEFRESSTKAGAKLCELLLAGDEETDGEGVAATVADVIENGSTPGHYPVVFGVVAQRHGSRPASRMRTRSLLG